MSRILYVSSSPRGSASYSNRVAARVIRELRQADPQTTVTVRDLAQDPLPHLDVDSGDNAAFDLQVPWLRNILGFLGMTDVEVIRIEGTALGAEAADKALERTTAQARELVGALAAA
jgi:FMN-dependent NADH-azoreductase